MNNVELDLPLSEWAGQLAGAVSSVFLRRFPDYEMPSEEVAAMVDKFMACPPTPIGSQWPYSANAELDELVEVDQTTWLEPDHVTALRLAVDLSIAFMAAGGTNSPVKNMRIYADDFLDWLRKNQPDE